MWSKKETKIKFFNLDFDFLFSCFFSAFPHLFFFLFPPILFCCCSHHFFLSKNNNNNKKWQGKIEWNSVERCRELGSESLFEREGKAGEGKREKKWNGWKMNETPLNEKWKNDPNGTEVRREHHDGRDSRSRWCPVFHSISKRQQRRKDWTGQTEQAKKTKSFKANDSAEG